MTAPSAAPTVTAAALPAATAPWAAGPTAGPGFDDEVRVLLRSRLILVHLLALLCVGLLQVLSWSTPNNNPLFRPDQGNPWLLAPPFAECLGGAVVLWLRPGLTLRALRGWEFVHFATLVAFFGWLRYVMLAHTAWLTPDPQITVGFYGLATLPLFTTTIVAYGVLVPNTRRRSLSAVAAIAAVPFLAAAAAAWTTPGLRDDLVPLLVQAAALLAFPAAIAVFAAARVSALQRRAFEAERRAERVGQYALKRKLGEGGMGEVWLAEHALLKRPCAVKFVRPEAAAHPAAAARFEREVRAVTGLSHANTVRVYDYGRADDGSFYLVMEYLDGPTLEALVRDAGPLPPGRAVYLLRQLCGALAEAHAAGLVHRDLKPGNVIVAALGGERDVAKLLDFGLVQDLSADPDARLTRAGTVMGTPAYMSPEQAAGEADVDARSDVYSLGAVAFFALAGRPPFQAKGLGQLLAAHRAEPAPPLADVRADVPADLAAVVARCLAKPPAERHGSAAELGQALAACACAGWSPDRAAGAG
ncbi:serine/threonine-protein kinase [Urbifossiella limnaea]|uniref:non-specific serine/threonine protein kinase n=1 Tax=Urbifossiella limnaea TaxID=2528023 RepID=A0A517XP86_9BACT|nr:serine/threonine-protein kinase [Urbifossiella limnaea]QDU19313.1 Serine/threonine-protein kinase PknB [Urbifossiella limnaea]